ncbi:hypothetical protein Sjap_001500 [Stephania japonica]|uniref:Uncharacterized protein n=1 Tax=Stephania japonica TaxID=461633 RepID=A0AAP0KMM3_9MAGN
MEDYSLTRQSLDEVHVDDDNNNNINNGEKGDELGSKASSGGVINTLISNLVTPLKEGYLKEPMKAQEEELQGNDEHGKTDDEVSRNQGSDQAERGIGGGGGNINNFITRYFNQNEAHNEVNEKLEETKEGSGAAGDHHLNSGGGIINNLVSSLPVSLPENVTPAPEEASILIHSIIHD